MHRRRFVAAGALSALVPHTHAAARPLRITYGIVWPCSTLITEIAASVLRRHLNVAVELLSAPGAPMWEAVAAGRADVLLCAWLPTTHAAYWQRYRHRVIDCATVASGTWLGLAVPDYVPIDSIDQLRDAHASLGDRIVGIDAGAGLMLRTREAIARYELRDLQLLTSSTVAMQAQLARAVERRRPIVVTAWKPLGIWARHPLKRLADPLGVFGTGDRIDALITPSLPQRAPRVVDFLRRYRLPLPEIEAMMLRLDDGVPLARVTSDWLRGHAAEIARWTQGDARPAMR